MEVIDVVRLSAEEMILKYKIDMDLYARISIDLMSEEVKEMKKDLSVSQTLKEKYDLLGKARTREGKDAVLVSILKGSSALVELKKLFTHCLRGTTIEAMVIDAIESASYRDYRNAKTITEMWNVFTEVPVGLKIRSIITYRILAMIRNASEDQIAELHSLCERPDFPMELKAFAVKRILR